MCVCVLSNTWEFTCVAPNYTVWNSYPVRLYLNQALEVGFEETRIMTKLTHSVVGDFSKYPLSNPVDFRQAPCPGLSVRDLAGNFRAAQETAPSSHQQAASRSATWAVPTRERTNREPVQPSSRWAIAWRRSSEACGNSTFSSLLNWTCKQCNAAVKMRPVDSDAWLSEWLPWWLKPSKKLVAVQFLCLWLLTVPCAVKDSQGIFKPVWTSYHSAHAVATE